MTIEPPKPLTIPSPIPVLPVRGGVVFPNVVAPLMITTKRSAQLIDEALAADKLVCVVAQRNPEPEEPAVEELYAVGTVALVLRMLRLPDGSMRLLVQGVRRAAIGRYVQQDPYYRAEIEPIEEKDAKDVATEALMSNLTSMFHQFVQMAPYLPEELEAAIVHIDSPSKLADFIASYVNFDVAEKQALLETVEPKDRLTRLTPLLSKEISILELGAKIRDQVKSELDKSQREYYLREQLKAIQKELGEVDERAAEFNDLKEKIEKAKMPKAVEETARRELDRLAKMPVQAAEYTVARTYLDWLVGLPWSVTSTDQLDVRRAQRILDEDHYDLAKVKERIIEYLAVRRLRPASKGPILCFVGPPGVGKTSLGKSIARALGRKFVRFSLGGIRDEAEIRGHRRTYVGALPGRILQGLRSAGTRNPVFMLDEIDKVGADFRGDPSSALLEVLDPEQNFSFSDHYLEVQFDLSQVMFIATANLADPIIPALKDRMEILELPGYILEEKLMIARRYLVPRQLREAGLTPADVRFPDQALIRITDEYTREAGVRNLEREIGSITRKVARRFAEGRRRPVVVTPRLVRDFLGPQKFFSEVAARQGQVGIATGLVWTPVGGEIVFVEATKMKGQKGLTLTGSLGDVMKESAQAALSFIRARARQFGVDEDFFGSLDLHIHVPAGGVPKDGPSAGVTIATALISLLRGQPVDPRIAMTGEITLSGRVLPVGGVKEKVLGAKRAGIRTVLLPTENARDLAEIPAKVKKGLRFRFVRTIEDVFRHALGIRPGTRSASRSKTKT